MPTCDSNGSPGPFGVGCDSSMQGYYPSGGGGGGYYGGGSSWIGGGGGGGGSSYSLYDIIETGYNIGDGYAVLQWGWTDFNSFSPRAQPTKKPTFLPTATASPTLSKSPIFSQVPTVFSTPSASPTAIVMSPLQFNCVYEPQNFKVPENVTFLRATLYAGEGAFGYGARGGHGAMISSIIPVTPGEILLVMVGSVGGEWKSFNGGGIAPRSGGGATDIRRSPYTLTDRVLIAGGGGGGGQQYQAFGGNGGLKPTKYVRTI